MASDSAEYETRQWMRFTASSAGILVTQRIAPFTVQRVFADSTVDAEPDFVRARATRDDRLITQFSDSTLRRWVSLPAVAIGDGYLQTLADVKSDERRLIFTDGSTGDWIARVVNAPMGFLASDPAEAIAIAIRRIDVQEVVVYQVQTQ